MSDAPLDLLAFGPHPDDIEIGMAGTLALHAAAGYRVGLCDLTRGELGSNGTPDERLAEAEAARAVLGAAIRVNLALPDGNLRPDDESQIRRIVDCVRQWRPRSVAIPYWRDRHPDHVAASALLTRAIFNSGLRRFAGSGAASGAPNRQGDAWRPDWVCYYFINDSARPSFVVDVSAHYARKREALACHRTQFTPAGADAASTRLTSPLFLQLVESRDAQFGALSGVSFAEGFVVRETMVRPHLMKQWTDVRTPARGAEPAVIYP
jgi:bacillithiol biosynthesis deacetylase BshB1